MSTAHDDGVEPQGRVAADEFKKLGHYEIQRKIGAGGMGAVYLALDTKLKRIVALKILPRDRADNPTLVKRFQSEAQKAAQLKHENIIAVFDAGEMDGYCYIALEYVDGIDVHNLVERRGLLSAKRSLDIVKQTTRALQNAYEKGIVHRDIKPSNLMIRRDGKVKLADMGLARSLDDDADTGITRAGTTVGTVDYMSPEQARDSKSADIRSDIYSLGCTWYHMVTGKPPFSEGSLTNKLRAHAQTPPPDPRLLNENFPEGMVAVMQRMMAKDPAQRHQNPKELLADLESADFSRKAISENVLAALAEAEVEDVVPTTPSGPRMLPPKASPSNAAEEEKGGIRLRPLVLLAAVAIGVAASIGIATLVEKYGDGFDAPIEVRRPESVTEPATPVVTVETVDPRFPVRPPITSKRPSEPEDIDDPEAPRPPPRRNVDPVLVAEREAVEQKQLPNWVTPEPPPTVGPRLVVRPGANSPGTYPTLETAQKALPRTGGVLELVGPGPFLLPPAIWQNSSLSIIAAQGPRPLVVFLPAAEARQDALVQFANGNLRLEGLDLALLAEQFSGSEPLALWGVHASHLSVRNCSLTVRGKRAGPVTAFRIKGTAIGTNGQPMSTQLLIDGSLIRGDDLKILSLDAPNIECVLRHSLLIAGTEPVLTIEGGYANVSQQTRNVNVVSSTLSGKGGFQVDAGGMAEPASVELSLLNSLMTSTPGTDHSALLLLEGWPQNAIRTPQNGPFKNFNWRAEHSLMLGWNPLIHVGQDELLTVNNAEQWRQLWRDDQATGGFSEEVWPPTSSDENEIARWDPQTVSTRSVKSSEGGVPGCWLDQVPLPDLRPLGIATIQAQRPLPPLLTPPGKTLHVDLVKDDLGRVLRERDWGDGLTVIASGFGARYTSPVSVKGKSLRIIFEQTPGARLVVTPRVIENRDGEAKPPAFFSVEQGKLELVNGHFDVPRSQSHIVTDWFIQVNGGSFSLHHCWIQAPLLGDSRIKGLIHWPLGQPATDGGLGKFSAYGLIQDSFLVSTGKLLDFDLSERALLVRNSVLVSEEDLFVIQSEQTGNQPGTLDLEHATLAAGGDFLQVRTPTPLPQPLRIFASESVFAPPLRKLASHPQTLLTGASPELLLKNLEWWEEGCGYAPEIATWHATTGKRNTSPQEFEPDWLEFWGKQRVRRALTGVGGVMLDNPATERTLEQPRQYALHPSGKAMTWGQGGTPIGAHLEHLGELPPSGPRPPPKPRKKRPKKGPTSF